MKLRMTADGALLRVLPDGRTEPAEQPGAEEFEAHSPRTAALLVQVARARLGLSQAGFAVRLRLPAGTLRDWEQARRMPDAAAITLMRLVAGAPQAMQRLTTRFGDAGRASAYLEKFANAAGRALLRAEVALVLRHSPFDARALSDAAGDAPPKLKQALAQARGGTSFA